MRRLRLRHSSLHYRTNAFFRVTTHRIPHSTSVKGMLLLNDITVSVRHAKQSSRFSLHEIITTRANTYGNESSTYLAQLRSAAVCSIYRKLKRRNLSDAAGQANRRDIGSTKSHPLKNNCYEKNPSPYAQFCFCLLCCCGRVALDQCVC
jgi:hypothetical protein